MSPPAKPAASAKPTAPADPKLPKLPKPSKLSKPVPAPSREAIAKRAYELYLQRGSEAGYELEDWLAAEAELIAAATTDAGD